LESFI